MNDSDTWVKSESDQFHVSSATQIPQHNMVAIQYHFLTFQRMGPLCIAFLDVHNSKKKKHADTQAFNYCCENTLRQGKKTEMILLYIYSLTFFDEILWMISVWLLTKLAWMAILWRQEVIYTWKNKQTKIHNCFAELLICMGFTKSLVQSLSAFLHIILSKIMWMYFLFCRVKIHKLFLLWRGA